jgi:hypothetical protein
MIRDTHEVVVEHNTVLQTGPIIVAHTRASEKFVFRNNVTPHNEYGVMGDGSGIGNVALAKYFPGAVFVGNQIAGGKSALYPAGNSFPPTATSKRIEAVEIRGAKKADAGADRSAPLPAPKLAPSPRESAGSAAGVDRTALREALAASVSRKP